MGGFNILETPACKHGRLSRDEQHASCRLLVIHGGKKQQVQHSSSAHPLCTQEEYGAIPCNRVMCQTPCHLTIVSTKAT
jgi:hypothetical protein